MLFPGVDTVISGPPQITEMRRIKGPDFFVSFAFIPTDLLYEIHLVLNNFFMKIFFAENNSLRKN